MENHKLFKYVSGVFCEGMLITRWDIVSGI